jgi:ariadne-1
MEEDDIAYEYEDDGDQEYYEYDNENINDGGENEKTGYDEIVYKESDTPVTPNTNNLLIPFDSYIIKPIQEVHPFMENLIHENAMVLGVSEDEAAILLQKFKWDKEKLIDAYFNNVEKTRKDAGLEFYTPLILDNLLHPLTESSSTKTFSCRIRFCCDENCLLIDGFELGCGHMFCRPCYAEYLRNVVLNDGPLSIKAKCPEHKCTSIMTRSIVRTILDTANFIEERNKYDSYLIRNFIETSKHMRFCPAPR